MDKTGVVEWEGQTRSQQGQLMPLAGELSGDGGNPSPRALCQGLLILTAT